MSKEQLRMCCVCRQKKPKEDLIRFTLSDGKINLNEGKQIYFGRSAYICRCQECINLALKKRSLNRAFKREVSTEVYEELTKFL